MRQAVLDLFALGGLGAFLAGVHQVYPPAALIIGGLVVTGVAIALTKKAGAT